MKEYERKIDKLIEELRQEVESLDNESIHAVYDEIILAIAMHHDKKLVKEVASLVKGITFWYA